jgi:hypothetical protein
MVGPSVDDDLVPVPSEVMFTFDSSNSSLIIRCGKSVALLLRDALGLAICVFRVIEQHNLC